MLLLIELPDFFQGPVTHLSSLNPLPHSDSKELQEEGLSKEKSVSESCFFLRKEIQPFWRQELPEH